VADIPLDLDGSFLAARGVDRAGDVLLSGAKGPGGYGIHPLYPRWLDPMGAPLTDWFAIGETCIRNPILLEMPVGRDGSLITQRWLPGATRGAFEVYPGLFH
jgi:hypothetical protein